MGLFWSDILGTVNSYLRIGKTGPRLKDSSGALHARDAGDTAFADVKAKDFLARHLQVRNALDTGYAELEFSGGATTYTQTLPNASGTLVVDATMQWRFLASNLVPSAVSSVDFTLPGNGQANSEYAAYKIILFQVAPATDNVVFWLRTSTNGGSSFDAGASDYAWSNFIHTEAAVTAVTGDTADNEIQLTGNSTVGNSTNEHVSGEITIVSPSEAKCCTVLSHLYGVNLTPTQYSALGTGRRETTADVDAIRFMFSSGNIASGKFYLYGLRASAS